VRSQADTFSLNVPEQARVGVGIWVLPLVFSARQGLDTYAGLQQHVVGDVGQHQLGVEEGATRTPEQDGQVGIAVRPKVAAGATPEQDRRTEGYSLETRARKTRIARMVCASGLESDGFGTACPGSRCGFALFRQQDIDGLLCMSLGTEWHNGLGSSKRSAGKATRVRVSSPRSSVA